ncbi:MAG: V-type ATP synthase subunit F [Candidatus Hodarchaeales archaeon]
MPSSILIVTHPSLAIGYRLAGADVFETDDGSIAFSHLQNAVKDDSIGIIGIDEGLYNSINPRFLEAIKKRGKPLILSMQSVLEGGMSTDEYIRMMTLSTAGVIVKVERD